MLAARFSNELAIRLLAILVTCAVGISSRSALADDATPEDLTPAAAATAEAESATTEISEEAQGYIDQLDAEVFGDRQAASQGLAKLGKSAVPALEKAIEAGSAEAASRSFELLQRLFEKGDDAAQRAARAALERLAKDSGPTGQRAKQLLAPAKPTEEAGPQPPAPLGGVRIRLGGGGIAPIPVVAAPVVNRRSMKVSNNNGVKTIEVEVNDDKVKIVDDPERGINVEITKSKGGKESTEKFAAKNAEDLKTNHPEAFKVYEQYSKGAVGNIRVEANVGGPPPLAARENLKAAIKRLEEEIEETKNNASLPEDFRKKHVENIERHRDRLKESLK